MNGSYKHQTTANKTKIDRLADLFPAFHLALGALGSITRLETLNGHKPTRWRETPGNTPVLPDTLTQKQHDSTEQALKTLKAANLSGRQLKSAQNMVYEAVSSWQENLTKQVRRIITNSTLPDERKTILYRINARKAWWQPSLQLPWYIDPDTNRHVVPDKDNHDDDPNIVWLPVAPEDLKLGRRLAKQAQHRCRWPNLTRTKTLKLDSIIAKPSRAATATHNGTITWWVKIASLTKGKPVNIPLKKNTYFESQYASASAAGGKLCGSIQLHQTPTGIAVSLITEQPDAKNRKKGETIGVDFGWSSALLATSTGQLHGHALCVRLREYDAVLLEMAKKLQKKESNPKQTPPTVVCRNASQITSPTK